MSSAPFMQFYVSDYLGDTQHLTTEQHGAYLLVLMAMWRNGGALPNDEKKLARIARVNPRRWHLLADDVMAFFDVADGFVAQKRLVEEYKKATSISEKRSASGKLGGNAKALKNNDEGVANAKQMPKHSQISDTMHHKDKTSPNGEDTRKALFPSQAFDAEFSEAFWPRYPHKIGKPVALKAYRSARKKTGADEIMAGLEAYVSKTDDRPWCNPATWLNQERWADKPNEVQRGPPKIVSAHVARHEEARRILTESIASRRRQNEPDSENTIDLDERDWSPFEAIGSGRQ